MKKTNRILSMLLAVVMVVSMLPVSVFAVDAKASTNTGLVGIVKPWDNTLSAGEYTYDGKYTGDYVYMGKYKGKPIKWRVLAEPERVEDTLLNRGIAPNVIPYDYLMISDEILDNVKYDSDSEHWTFNKSEAQEWSNDFLADSFSDEEKEVIKKISDLNAFELDYNAATAYVGTSLWDVQMFFPSAQEVVDYMPDARDRIAYYNGTPAKWWLRDTASNKVKQRTMVGNVLENGLASSDYATNTYGARPAFYLDWSELAYLVPANNDGVINFGERLPGLTREWKLVLKKDMGFADNAQLVSNLEDVEALELGYEAVTLAFEHSSINSFAEYGATHIMASIEDINGNVYYYGIVTDNQSAISSTVTIPAGLPEGGYTLSLFPADINSSYEADYIDAEPFKVSFSVESELVCAINDTNFPDDNFRYYIWRYVDTNESNSISWSEVENCTYMDLSGREIEDLTGISYFTSLENLNVMGNKLSELNLSQNIKLESLNCADNLLTTLDLTANVNLTSLWCAFNDIESLDVSENIEDLDLVSNNLPYFDLNEETDRKIHIMADGQRISLEMNASRQIDMSEIVSDVSRIEMISGGSIENGIITVDRNATQIAYKYYCSSAKNNCVEVIADVTHRTIGINESYFPDSLFREYVKQFDTDKDGALSAIELAAVEWISLDDVYYETGSKVTDLIGIEHFTELTELHCANNALTTLDLSKNTKLEKLYCVNNELVSLDLSNNTELKWLYCAANNLTELNLSKNKKLEHLDAGHNRLEQLDLSQNTLLDSLGVGLYSEGSDTDEGYANMLTELDLSALVNLTYLDASGNQLTSIDLSKNTKLTNINLSYNRLAGVDLGNLTTLEYVSLEGNTVYVDAPNGGSIALSDIGITADKVKSVTEPAMLMGTSIVLSSDGIAEYQYDTGLNLPETPENPMGSTMFVTLVSHTDEDHTLSDVYAMNGTRHWKYCTICRVKKENEIHSYSLKASNNNDTHTVACVCGSERIEDCENRNADCVNLPTECTVCCGSCAVQSIKHRGPFVKEGIGNFYVSLEHANYARNLKCLACGEDAYKGVSLVASYSERSVAVEFDDKAATVIVEKVPGTSVTVRADDVRDTWEEVFTEAQKKAVGEAVVIGGVRADITARGSDGAQVPISDLGDGTASIYMPVDAGRLPVNWKPEGIVAQYIGVDGTVERVPVTVAVSTSATVSGAFDADNADRVATITSSVLADNSITINDGNTLIASLVSSNMTKEQAANKIMQSLMVYAKVDVSHFSDYVILYDEDLIKKTVTFDSQGGTIAATSEQTTVDGKLLTLPSVTKEGQTFVGWFDAATGGNEITADTVYAADATIYAQWKTAGTGEEPHTHNFEWVVDKEATATETGLKHEECSCGEKRNENTVIPATGEIHTHYFEWVIDKEATETEDGIKHEECACSEKRNENTTIPKTGTDNPTTPTEPTKHVESSTPTESGNDVKSPQTGDNSNIWLWVALLFVSGAGLAGMTIYGRKRRTN